MNYSSEISIISDQINALRSYQEQLNNATAKLESAFSLGKISEIQHARNLCLLNKKGIEIEKKIMQCQAAIKKQQKLEAKESNKKAKFAINAARNAFQKSAGYTTNTQKIESNGFLTITSRIQAYLF